MTTNLPHPNRSFGVRLVLALCISVIAICSYFAIPTARAAQKFNGKIAYFTDNDSLAFDIFLINPDGSGRTRITDDKFSVPSQFGGTFDMAPAWSPDGTKLAFVSNRHGRLGQIYSMNADGTNITRLSDDTSWDQDPAWSPDGSKIAFTRGGGCVIVLSRSKGGLAAEDDDPCTPFIYLMNVDGANRVNLSQIPGVRPVWSPDGTRIAFSSPTSTFNHDIFIMNADGSNRIQLTNASAHEVVSSWSPDGERLLFTSNQDAPTDSFINEIYTMKVDGTDVVRLTDDQVDEQGPVFSPDGTKIAFQRGLAFGENQNAEIIVMNADGSNPTNVTNSTSEDFGPPAWQSLSAPLEAPTPAVMQFDSPAFSVNEGNTSLQINILRTGNTAEEVSLKVDSANVSASDVSDYARFFETLHFAPGETSKSISLLLTDDAFVEGTETFSLKLHDLTGNSVVANSGSTTVSIIDNDVAPPTANPLDNSVFFVRQHYHDFLNREPDPEGLAFWVNNIESCGANAACRELKRIDTSAAFFLSIEFQRTGFYVFRLWTGTLRAPDFMNFMRDTQTISKGLIVGAPGWALQLDANTQKLTEEFVSRPIFRRMNPETLTADQYVDLLYSRAGLTPPPDERLQAIAAFGIGDTAGRARALRIVVDNATFTERLFTSGFVQEQYFGYLRREFDFEGFFFWRAKLDSFNGDFRKAEMVKAFLNSSEYRSRFGPP